jgi:hypothetical protein
MTDEPVNRYIKLGDGYLIDTETGKRTISTEVNRAFSDEPGLVQRGKITRIDGVHRRFLDDIPTGTPEQSRAVAIIAGYAVFGLDPVDIAYIMKVKIEIVEGVMASDAYSRFLDSMLQNIREHDRDVIRKRINRAAGAAVSKIIDLSENSRDEKVALAASRDILDRNASESGISGNNGGSTLSIRIVDDRDNPMDKMKVEIDG